METPDMGFTLAPGLSTHTSTHTHPHTHTHAHTFFLWRSIVGVFASLSRILFHRGLCFIFSNSKCQDCGAVKFTRLWQKAICSSRFLLLSASSCLFVVFDKGCVLVWCFCRLQTRWPLFWRRRQPHANNHRSISRDLCRRRWVVSFS